MKLTFLGTGTSQGVPVIACECEVCLSSDLRDKRLRTSALISYKNTNIVIDTGPDFRTQMLRENVKHLEAVIFTHPHKDHTAGLDDIRPFVFKQQKPMDVYADENTQNQLRREFSYIFDGTNYPGIPKLTLHTIEPYKKFQINEIEILPLIGYHYKLPVLGFKIGNSVYFTDVNKFPEETLKHLYNLDVLVINALRWEPHISHFTLPEAIELARKLKAKRTYFTHISHLLGKHEEVSKQLPENMFLAYDGLKIDF